MADREFVFGNPKVRALITENFVPLAMDDWYLRRQDDAHGSFFRDVANQGPRKGEGGGTRQGRYAFSASGKLLGFNNNRSPERIVAMLDTALERYRKLPLEEKSPKVETNASRDSEFLREPPKGGAVIKVYTRVLKQNSDQGALQRCKLPAEPDGRFRHNGFGASIDHCWLRQEDIESLAPSKTKAGETISIPEAIAIRIARFHLADNTRGEPPHWRKGEIRQLDLIGKVAENGRVRIDGHIHLETKDGKRGFQGKALGGYSLTGSVLSDFELVVVGEHWGEGRYTGGARPGKNPIGFSFALVADPKPADRIPPQGSRWLDGYYEAHRR